jgi:hypothetical protein
VATRGWSLPLGITRIRGAVDWLKAQPVDEARYQAASFVNPDWTSDLAVAKSINSRLPSFGYRRWCREIYSDGASDRSAGNSRSAIISGRASKAPILRIRCRAPTSDQVVLRIPWRSMQR